MIKSQAANTYWWLAINGPSCAASFVPLPVSVTVIPRPEQLVGFLTEDEARSAQRFLLTAPIREVGQYMKRLTWRAKAGEVVILFLDNPESPTTGPTLWMAAPEGVQSCL